MRDTRTGGGRRRVRRWVSLLLVLAMTQDAAAQKIVITPKGVQKKPPNQRIMLRCALEDYVSTDKHPTLRWKAPSGEWITATSGDVYIELDDPTLVRLFFRRLSVDDAGNYSCEATLGTRMLGAQTTLELIEPVQFDESPGFVQHEKGSSPLLSCEASGRPAPVISWRFNRRKIPKDSDKYTYEKTGLRIASIDLADNGTYYCRAEVVFQGTLKVKTITLDVLYAPVIVRGPNTTSAIKNENVTLDCKANGNPPVSYQWYREQKMSDMIKVKVLLPETRATYVIPSLQEGDEGRYFCKVSNSLGIEEAFADLKVLIPPEVEPLPHKVVLEGRTVIMVCRALGVPEPIITWRRIRDVGGHVSSSTLNDPRLTIDQTQPGVSRVVIDDVKRADAGLYACTARSVAGTDSKNGTLTVEYLPTVNMTDFNKIGWVGEKRRFTCVGQGMPLPTMNWYRGSQYISRNSIYDVSVVRTPDEAISTLEVTIEKNQPWVFGEYSCIAKNQYGYVTETVFLRQAHVPEAPRDVSVVNETTTAVTLSASSPQGEDGLPITSWMVTCEKEGGTAADSKTHFFGEGHRMSVTGLEQGQTYILYLAAGNAVGFGDVAKFRVCTQRETPAEQADVPRSSGGGPRDNYSSVAGKHENLGGKRSSARDRTTMASGGVNNIAVIVGVAVSAASLLVLVVAVLLCRRRRRKRDDYALSVRCVLGGLGPTTVDDDLPNVVASSGYKDRPLPDIVYQKNSDRHKSPALSRQPGHQAADGGATVCTADTPTSIQKQAWEQMLQKHDGVDEEGQEEPRMRPSSSVTSLPPPPSFLLEEDADGDDDDDDDAASYQDILDGYHSEDNIDDDLPDDRDLVTAS